MPRLLKQTFLLTTVLFICESFYYIIESDFTDLFSLDSVIEEGGKPSNNSTGSTTDETPSATSNEQSPTSTSGSNSTEQGNSGSYFSVGVYNYLVPAFVLFMI
jgi:hypothetical protein